MLQGLDLEADSSLLPDCRKKLIPYNPKVKMHKPGAEACPDAWPTIVAVQAWGGARQPSVSPSADESPIQNAMGMR